jgi:hypothetical protein
MTNEFRDAALTGSREGAQEAVRDAASNATSKAQEMVRDQVNQRSNQAGEQVSSVASDLRSVGEELRQQGKDKPAQYTEQVAERVERASNYLSDADADRILDDAEDLARRQPWLTLAGGIVLGIAAARFLKASSSERYASRGRELTPSPPRDALPQPAGGTPQTPTPEVSSTEAPTAPAAA